MSEIKIYKSPWKAIKLLALACPFIIGSVWAIKTEPYGTFDNFMGWFCICFFGLGLPVGLFHLFDRRPQIIINETGVWDRTTNQDLIKWEQIKRAYPINIYGQKFISLVVDDSFVIKRKQYKWAIRLSEAVGAQKINLHLGQIRLEQTELIELINRIKMTDLEKRLAIIERFSFNKK